MSKAFTLVELLVVVTIIALLLALLAPAMDRAIYVAELSVCAARLKMIASAGTSYAANNHRFYPSRRGYLWDAVQVENPGVFSHRKSLNGYLALGTFLDPLCGKIDLSDGANVSSKPVVLYANYHDVPMGGWPQTWTLGQQFRLR